jgi:alpha-galactosidase
LRGIKTLRGEQGRRVWQEGKLARWVKPLADGGYAVGLFSRTASALQMNFEFKAPEIEHPSKVRDLWQDKDL